ncbi:origin recognition complex subunit 2 ORC2 [Gracilaria domingensis]|nr:origin recognition complex subunit 2 ORC2 [Gracilaria domingensis]
MPRGKRRSSAHSERGRSSTPSKRARVRTRDVGNPQSRDQQLSQKRQRGRLKTNAAKNTQEEVISKAIQDVQEEEEIGAGRSYFEAHKGVVRTSNLTLANLSIASQEQLENALHNFEHPLKREQEFQLDTLRKCFQQYLYILEASHSLLFYGFGSKKKLLDEFAQYLTKSHAIMVVNAFNPTLSLRSILAQIAKDFLNCDGFPKRTLSDYIDAIRRNVRHHRIGIVIHNIDGPSLRSSENQNVLATLSSIPGISIAASIDHVNAPLLWDGAMYSKFEWAWIKADTFAPYDAETVYSSKPLLHGGRERRVEGAVALLTSLSKRARQVFEVLAQRQLDADHAKSTTHSAISRTTFNQLFEITKEKFLTTDANTLRGILTELHTHDLLQSKRGADAAEQLWIPLHKAQLEAIILEINSVEKEV